MKILNKMKQSPKAGAYADKHNCSQKYLLFKIFKNKKIKSGGFK